MNILARVLRVRSIGYDRIITALVEDRELTFSSFDFDDYRDELVSESALSDPTPKEFHLKIILATARTAGDEMGSSVYQPIRDNARTIVTGTVRSVSDFEIELAIPRSSTIKVELNDDTPINIGECVQVAGELSIDWCPGRDLNSHTLSDNGF